jgi:hypothetical protein
MPDWTAPPFPPGDLPPGDINPPAPSEIKPSTPGWSQFVDKEVPQTGLKWTPNCLEGLTVEPTGSTMTRPIDGDNPTDYTADKDWGWKEDRTYKTQPPEPYRDFTRWVRHYPRMRTQKYVEYRATVFVVCGTQFVNRPPRNFWKPEGDPQTGPVDVYTWTETSGLKTDADGHTYTWETSGKKPPPTQQSADPDSLQLRPNETPPSSILFPPYRFGPDWLGPRLDWSWQHDGSWPHDWSWPPHDWYWPRYYSIPFVPGTKDVKWFRIGDRLEADGARAKPERK